MPASVYKARPPATLSSTSLSSTQNPSGQVATAGTPWDSQIDAIVCGLIHETTRELARDVKGFEKEMKRSVMNK